MSNSKKHPTPTDFLLTTPLYQRVEYVGEEIWKAINLLHFQGTFDSYCIQCERDSTFKSMAPRRPVHLTRDHAREEAAKLAGTEIDLPDLDPTLHEVPAVCTRDSNHKHHFVFLVTQDLNDDFDIIHSLQKIGQHPSYSDLNLARVKDYASVLSKAQLGELSRAVGLASHDVGIGSYVYLRRIFESLVEEAHRVAVADPGWDDDAYMRSRMTEKIRLLKDHLPSFLSEHPEMYSLLSKGIHELSEDDCLTHFNTLKLGIELILDEKLEVKRREKKIKAAKEAISSAVRSTSQNEG